MSDPSVEYKVKQIIIEKLNVTEAEVTNETTFGDLGADSLDRVEIILQLETEFKIVIPDEKAEKINTVGEAIEYVQKEVENI